MASRRDFLKQATLAAGGAAALPALAAAAGQVAPAAPAAGPGPSSPTAPSTMRRRVLGRTGLEVSEIGFGGFPIDDAAILKYALDQGINYVDTAHCYRGGRSEEIIGEALQGRR